VITIVLGVLAMLLWCQGWWNGARPDLGGYVGSELSNVVFLRACATMFSIAACIGWVLLTLTEAFSIGELHCRKCRYILKGLSEPRCPECGTPIWISGCGPSHNSRQLLAAQSRGFGKACHKCYSASHADCLCVM